MSWRTSLSLAIALAGLALTGGCNSDDKHSAADAGAPDAGPDPSLMDPKLADALRSARPSASGMPGVPGDGPPANGIFAPGGADKAHAIGAPVKIELLNKGEEPRVVLRPKLALEGKKTLVVQVGKRFHQQGLPNVDYTLDVKVEGTGATEGAKQPAPDSPSKPTITFTITKVKASQQQMGQLPPDVDEKLGGLKGTAIKANLEPDGSIANEVVELGKDTNKGLVELANALQEMLAVLFSPWPAEPVGKGAFWLAGDRTRVGGMDVVRYRHTTVEELQGDDVAVSINVRLYSAIQNQLPVAIGPQPGLSVVQFESFGKAVIARKVSELLPSAAKCKIPIQLALSQDPQKQQPGGELTIESNAAILSPGGAKEPKEPREPNEPAPPPAPAPAPAPPP